MFANDIKVWNVPHVDGLRSADLISFIINDCDGEQYLPRNYSEYTPNRTWLANICTSFLYMSNVGNSLNYEGFRQKVKEVLAEREEKILNKYNLSINIDPRIASIFKLSSMISSK